MSGGQRSGNRWEEDPTGTAAWAFDPHVEADYDTMLLKMSKRVQELSGPSLELRGPPPPKWPYPETVEPEVFGGGACSTSAPKGLSRALLNKPPPATINMDKPVRTDDNGDPISEDEGEDATPAPPPIMGRTRFFSRVRSALLETRKTMETLVIKWHPEGYIDPEKGRRYLPPEVKSELEATFEESIAALTDEVYGAFMYAGSKHTAAGHLAESFEVLLNREREERQVEKEAHEAALAALKAELAEEKAKKDNHKSCRRMLLMAHDRVDVLESFKRKYNELKVNYDRKVEEQQVMQQKLTTQSLSQSKLFMEDIKKLRTQLAELRIKMQLTEKALQKEQTAREATEKKMLKYKEETKTLNNQINNLSQALIQINKDMKNAQNELADEEKRHQHTQKELVDVEKTLKEHQSTASKSSWILGDLQRWLGKDAPKPWQDVTAWMIELAGAEDHFEWMHSEYGFGKMLMWLWGAEGHELKFLHEWAQKHIPLETLPLWDKEAFIAENPEAVQPGVAHAGFFSGLPEGPGSDGSSTRPPSAPKAQPSEASVVSVAPPPPPPPEPAGWAYGHLYNIPPRLRPIIYEKIPANLMEADEVVQWIVECYTEKWKLDEADEQAGVVPEILAEYLYDKFLASNDGQEEAYKELNRLMHSIDKISVYTPNKHHGERVKMFLRFLGPHHKPLSPTALRHYLGVFAQMQATAGALVAGEHGQMFISAEHMEAALGMVIEPFRSMTLDMLKNPTEVAPLAKGPGAGLYDVDAVLATVVKAWEDQMYQPEVLMKAAFHKFDDNGDGVLNSTEFHNLVINFNKTATERDSLRMFKDALDAAAEHGFTGGTISPEVFVEIAHKYKLLGNTDGPALEDLMQAWGTREPQLREWLKTHGPKWGAKYPAVLAEVEAMLDEVQKALQSKASPHETRRYLERLTSLAREQEALFAQVAKPPEVRIVEVIREVIREVEVVREVPAESAVESAAPPSHRSMASSHHSLPPVETADADAQTVLRGDAIAAVMWSDPDGPEGAPPVDLTYRETADAEVTCFLRPRREEEDMIGMLEDEVDELRHELNWAMDTNRRYTGTLEALGQECVDAHQVAEEARAEVEHCLIYIERNELQRPPMQDPSQPPNWLRELEQQVRELVAKPKGDNRSPRPVMNVGTFDIPGLGYMQDMETQTTPRTTNTPRGEGAGDTSARRRAREVDFEARIRQEWAAREADWEHRRREINEIKTAWDLALVWWSHATQAIHHINTLKGDAIALTAHLLDAVGGAVGELGVMRRPPRSLGMARTPSDTSLSALIQGSKYDAEGTGDEDYEFTRLAIVQSDEGAGQGAPSGGGVANPLSSRSSRPGSAREAAGPKKPAKRPSTAPDRALPMDHPWGVPSDIQIRQMKGGKVLSSPREYPQPDDGNQLMPPAFAKPITDRPSNVPQAGQSSPPRPRVPPLPLGNLNPNLNPLPPPAVPLLPPLAQRAARSPMHAHAATHGGPNQWGPAAPRGVEHVQPAYVDAQAGTGSQEAATRTEAPTSTNPTRHENIDRWTPGHTIPMYTREDRSRQRFPMSYVGSYDEADYDDPVTDNAGSAAQQPGGDGPGRSPPRYPMRRALSNHLGPQYGAAIRSRMVFEW